jgi:hypothetical protein
MRKKKGESMVKSNLNGIRIFCIFFCLFGYFGLAAGQGGSASAELVGMLMKELNVTQDQATGGAGALFDLAKSRLKPEEFSQVSNAVPGMDGFLNAAPKQGDDSALGSLGSALSGGGSGGLASVAGAFGSLGLSPDMVSKFIPLITQYVQSKGGASVASLLMGVLK